MGGGKERGEVVTLHELAPNIIGFEMLRARLPLSNFYIYFVLKSIFAMFFHFPPSFLHVTFKKVAVFGWSMGHYVQSWRELFISWPPFWGKQPLFWGKRPLSFWRTQPWQFFWRRRPV